MIEKLNFKKEFCVYPLKDGTKQPLEDGWQEKSAIMENWPARVGLNCKKSGILGIDMDNGEIGRKEWFALCKELGISDKTLYYNTPHGTRALFRYLGGDITHGNLTDNVEFLGVNTVIPPTPGYGEFIGELAVLPNALRHYILEKTKVPFIMPIGDIVHPNRHNTLCSIAGKLWNVLPDRDMIFTALVSVNANQCKPPLPEKELRVIAYESTKNWESTHIAPKKEVRKKPKPMKDVLLKLALAKGVTLFTDQHQRVFCHTPRKDHHEILAVDSKKFGDWLSWQLYTEDGRVCTNAVLDPTKAVLREKARNEGSTHKLHNRVAWGDDGALYYDMSDTEWSAIKVTTEGWSLETTPPILFRRYVHQAPQVTPVQVDDAAEVLKHLFEFINLTNEDDRLLYTVYLISTLIPGIAHPIPNIHGEAGSGKTEAMKKTRKIVDPSDIGVLAMPHRSDFAQQLAHHWCAFYDNLKSLTDWQQDVFCRAVTGEGHTKRKLFTDEEDIIFTYRRCIGLNGINVTSARPDLLDRCILFELKVLGDQRKTEAELNADFEALRPQLFGAILSILSGALNVDQDVAASVGKYFRLADWAAWGYRIAESLGGYGDKFLDVYDKAVKEKSRQALELHPLGETMLAFMENKFNWSGTAKDLLVELESTAIRVGLKTDTKKDWPNCPAWLGRKLKVIKPDLRLAGITYIKDSRRLYTITKVHGNDTAKVHGIPANTALTTSKTQGILGVEGKESMIRDTNIPVMPKCRVTELF